MNPKVSSIRKTLKKVVGDRHEDAMTKFGAALALGIIDAGGRNCTIGLQTQTGNLNMAGIVGMAVFTQYWYWFPFTHFLSLSFSPTSIIGLDHDLEMPNFKFHCATRPSLFDYPPEQEVKTEEGPALIATAILRRSALSEERAWKSIPPPLKSGGDKMDVDEDKKADETKDKKEEQEKEPAASADTKKKPEKEKVGISASPAGRYKPVKKPTGGPLLLHDSQPDEEKSLLEEKLKKVTTERAPVAGQQTGRGGRGGAQRAVLDSLAESRGGANSAMLGQLLRNQGRSPFGLLDAEPQTPGGNASGAAAAAGVLTAVDEDSDDDEEAPVPKEFDEDDTVEIVGLYT
ncbi:26S proteasome regulatory subunit RPN2, C-terminal [Fusarium oxysporum f. sp. vasinfectum]|nr:26S proteasome regulatory subunit RPN2, C-terminal [Fusarium oxysporum f. sp. vasinfectum]